MDGEQQSGPARQRRRVLPSPMECFILLVIVCVLAFLMLSATAAPRELARRTVCMKNLREIGLVIQLYAADNAGRFPSDALATTVGSFRLLPEKYCQDLTPARHRNLYEAFVCPDDSMRVFSRVATGSPNKPLTARNLSYAYGGFSMTEEARPDSPIACDRSSNAKWDGPRPWARNKWTHETLGGNILFVDGRVAFTRIRTGRMESMKNP